MSLRTVGSLQGKVFTASSLLFVPGSRPDRFAKARAAQADLVVVDLEDAVAAADKGAAGEIALNAVAEARGTLAIRMNGLRTRHGIADLERLSRAEVMPAFLLVPMAESAVEVELIQSVLAERCPRLIPLIETPKGLRAAAEIAGGASVCALMFGGADFAACLGVAMEWEALLLARQQLVHACAEAGVGLIDVPFIAIDDVEGLERECARVRALGISAKAAIHPAQVPAINRAFRPSSDELDEALAALDAWREGNGAAIRFKGRLLEAPIIDRYLRVIEKGGSTRDA